MSSDAPIKPNADACTSGMHLGACEFGLQGFGKDDMARMMDSSMGGVLLVFVG